MTRIALIVALLLVSTLARSDEGVSFSPVTQVEGISYSKSASGGGGIIGSLLFEDNSSFLLLEDNSSHLCLEGGC